MEGNQGGNVFNNFSKNWWREIIPENKANVECIYLPRGKNIIWDLPTFRTKDCL